MSAAGIAHAEYVEQAASAISLGTRVGYPVATLLPDYRHYRAGGRAALT